MGRRATRRAKPSATSTSASASAREVAGPTGDVQVGAREPCPCGSGRRYKACHGRAGSEAAHHFVSRPFEGLPDECDWVALREIVPAATARLVLAGDHAGRSATVATVLPMSWPALVRKDGEVFVGLQVSTGSGDPSRDAAAVLLRAMAAEPGTPVFMSSLPGPGARLQDVLDLKQGLDVQVHNGFDFWLEADADLSGEELASMERANEALVPTVRLESVAAAYWCEMRNRNHLRWVMPQNEEKLLDAMARLHVAGADRIGNASRYVGSFRAHGLLVPVWDLESGTPAAAIEEPAAAFGERLGNVLADARPLDAPERAARAGLRSRQVTLR
jgi:hypothetical protein